MHVLKGERFELKLWNVKYVIRTMFLDFAFGFMNILLILVTCRNTEMGLICSVSDLSFKKPWYLDQFKNEKGDV